MEKLQNSERNGHFSADPVRTTVAEMNSDIWKAIAAGNYWSQEELVYLKRAARYFANAYVHTDVCQNENPKMSRAKLDVLSRSKIVRSDSNS